MDIAGVVDLTDGKKVIELSDCDASCDDIPCDCDCDCYDCVE